VGELPVFAEGLRIAAHTHTRTRAREQSFHKSPRLNQTQWPESASELYRPSDRRLSAKIVPTFADRGCHVVSMTDP
jgi:hypothetical protein